MVIIIIKGANVKKPVKLHPTHFMDQFYSTLLQTNFIISTDVLCINFNVFNNPSILFCMLE
jgi:hypothetical protein